MFKKELSMDLLFPQDENERYKIESYPRGYALLVLIDGPDHCDDCSNKSQQMEKLEDLLFQFEFEVIKLVNPSKKELLHSVRDLSCSDEQRNRDAFLMFVIGPGLFQNNTEHIICSDKQKVDLQCIWKKFNNGDCCGLVNKPKLFIFQLTYDDFFVDEKDGFLIKSVNYEPNLEGEGHAMPKLPTFSDILVVTSHLEGKSQQKCRSCWLFEVFYEHFVEFSGSEDVNVIINMVDQKLREKFKDGIASITIERIKFAKCLYLKSFSYSA